MPMLLLLLLLLFYSCVLFAFLSLRLLLWACLLLCVAVNDVDDDPLCYCTKRFDYAITSFSLFLSLARRLRVTELYISPTCLCLCLWFVFVFYACVFV